MKIEKINDRQIRCTLTREDLASREIKLSELAYGSEKAKELFQDMMQTAAEDFGFEADNMPLVIEAIPISMDAIVLIITKVDDPEELDTRFARFSPEVDGTASSSTFSALKDKIEGADDVLGMIRRIADAKKQGSKKEESRETAASDSEAKTDAAAAASEDEDIRNLTRVYQFRSLDDVIHAAAVLGSVYDGPNSLFKDPGNGSFYLLLRKADSSAEQFNKICNVLSEYGSACKYAPGMDAYFSEHMELILSGQALQNLHQLS